MVGEQSVIPVDRIESLIFLIRGQRVILDSDLARLYGVETKVLNQAVRRKIERFPDDFVFQLSSEEFKALRSQIVTSNGGRGGRRYPPFAFTEHGAYQASNVINSERAKSVSIFVVRAFVRLRNDLAANAEIAAKFAELERRMDSQDKTLTSLMAAIRQLMEKESRPIPKKRRIGFRKHDNGA